MTCTTVEAHNSDVIIPLPSPTIKSCPPSSTTLTQSQLVEAVAWIMEDIIEGRGKSFSLESEIPEKTAFHANTLPSIALCDYIARFSHYAKCQEDVLLYALIYLDRIGEFMAGFSLDSFNVHK